MKVFRFLVRRELSFSLGFFAFIYIGIRFPLKLLLTGDGSSSSKNLESIFVCALCILTAWLIARKFGLLQLGGFSAHKRKNYWLLLVPFVFPGFLAGYHIGFACIAGFSTLIIYVFDALIKGTFEEILFRGVMQGYIRKTRPDLSLHSVCLFTTTLFSLAHLLNLRNTDLLSVLNQLVYAFFTGLLFSALLLSTRNIWLNGIVHGMLNVMGRGCGQEPVIESIEQPLWYDFIWQPLLMAILMSPALLMYGLILRKNISDTSYPTA